MSGLGVSVLALGTQGLGVLPWSPLGGGWLTGKYPPGQRPTGTSRLGEDPARGVEAYDTRNNEHTWAVVDEVRRIAAAHEVPMGRVALAWVRHRPAVSSVILGARRVAQLDDNLMALEVELSVDETARLDMASAPGIPLYPYGFIESYCGYRAWAELTTRPTPPPIA